MGDLDQIFFAALTSFYDEKEKKASFQSEEFKELMQEYKNLKTMHAGELAPFRNADSQKMAKITECLITKGPAWIGALITEKQLADPSIKLSGIPALDGTRADYMTLSQPLAILNESDCKEEALDFVLYACKNPTNVYSAGGKVGETAASDQQTQAAFWVFEDFLKEDIWETDKACWVVLDELIGLAEEHKTMLRNLMDQAVGVTKAQNDVYAMFLEEMDGYLNGNKELDSCIDILQNRVSLYLVE